MNVNITSDTNPINQGEHKRKNWESPLMDKFNNAYDYLKSLDHIGDFHCHFNSNMQRFTPHYERCKGLQKEEIDDLIECINNL